MNSIAERGELFLFLTVCCVIIGMTLYCGLQLYRGFTKQRQTWKTIAIKTGDDTKLVVSTDDRHEHMSVTATITLWDVNGKETFSAEVILTEPMGVEIQSAITQNLCVNPYWTRHEPA